MWVFSQPNRNAQNFMETILLSVMVSTMIRLPTSDSVFDFIVVTILSPSNGQALIDSANDIINSLSNQVR
jgi:hypothetical protein